MNNRILSPQWNEYELLDSGDKEKFERYGPYTFIRPEPKALWKKTLRQKEWEKADAAYHQSGSKEGKWIIRRPLKESWQMKWREVLFKIRPTTFKHMGVFPESAVHWEWIQEQIKKEKRTVKILNLFAYTGGGTLAALAAGGAVTHVDASKSIVTWAHENATLAGLDHHPVRWIVDDAVTFVRREIKRGKKYDAIILDPPKFGRSESGKVWKFEDDVPRLLDMCREILSEQPLFFIINAYTVEFSSITLANLLNQILPDGTVDHGDIILPAKSGVPLPTSMFARWSI